MIPNRRLHLIVGRRRSRGLAFVVVVDPTQTVVPDGGLPAADLIALAEKDAKRLFTGFGQRAPQGHSSLEFVAVGKPAAEIVKTAKEWPADVIVITDVTVSSERSWVACQRGSCVTPRAPSLSFARQRDEL
jgi:nucleotide-binding universal stress UspA family protein